MKPERLKDTVRFAAQALPIAMKKTVFVFHTTDRGRGFAQPFQYFKMAVLGRTGTSMFIPRTAPVIPGPFQYPKMEVLAHALL